MERSRDGHSIVVIATSDRHYEPEPPRTEVAPNDSSLSVSVDDAGRLTVHALNSPLGDVLRRISEATGLRITIRGGAGYRASLAVRHVAPENLMRAIARAYGLSVRSVGGIYYVTEGLPTEVDSYWASPTATVRIQHMPADEAVELLPDFLLRYVHVSAGDNAVVATGPPQLLDKLEADLRAIDQPTPQIRLSALLVEQVTQGALDAASALVFADGRHELTTDGDTGRLGYRLVEDHLSDLQLKLRALQEAGAIRTRVCPSITVRSGAEGELFLGRRQYFAFARPTYSRDAMTQEVVLESADVGSRVFVEPWSGDGETITLTLTVQVNTILMVDSQGLPLVATRSAGGTVRLTSGDTIVFGGLALGSSDDRRRRAWPLRLPLIGDLGRARDRTRNTTQALVLLTAQASYDSGSFAPTPEQPASSPPKRSAARPPGLSSSGRPEALQRWYR
jgi:type II secretory pathway component GspD/PulD (secretin)